VKSLEDLRPYLVYEIEIFYRIQSLRGRKFKSVALSGPGKSASADQLWNGCVSLSK